MVTSNKIINLLLLLSISSLLYPCSIISLKSNDNYYMAGNEDWRSGVENSIKFIPAGSKTYGYAVISVSGYIDSYPQVVINQEGLSADWAVVPGSSFKRDKDKLSLNSPFLHEIMKNCKSVEEVIQCVNKYNVPQFAQEHLLVSDSSGDSAVLEWHKDRVKVIRRNIKYQIITNFDLFEREKAGYICDRYKKATNVLSSTPYSSGNIHLLTNILESMQMSGQFETLYSYVFDLKKKKLYIFNKRNYKEVAIIVLLKEIKNGGSLKALGSLNYITWK